MLKLDKAPYLARKHDIETKRQRITALCMEAKPHILDALKPFEEYVGPPDLSIKQDKTEAVDLTVRFNYKITTSQYMEFIVGFVIDKFDRVEYRYTPYQSQLIHTGRIDKATPTEVAEQFLSAISSRANPAFEALVLGERERLYRIMNH